MRKLLLYLSLLFSVVANAQSGIVAAIANNKVAAVPDDSTISFTNANIHKVWRDGVTETGTITPPSGYSTFWYIVNTQSRYVVDSGVGTTITRSFDFVTMDSCNIYDLRVVCTNGSTRQIVGHRNCVQLSGGSDGVEFYSNWVETNMANNLFVAGAGITGGNVEVHANVFYSGVGIGDIGNIWARADLSELYPGGISQKFYNNTIIYTAGVSAFTLYEAFATDFNKFEAVNNTIVGSTTTDYENGSGMVASHATFSNYELLTANTATALFVDSPNKDYRPSSLSSPMFGSSTSITKSGIYSGYDHDGYAYLGAYPIRGAYSGATLTI